MKKTMILVALCAAAIAGCGPKTPEAVAIKCIELTCQGDFEGVKKYMSKDAIKEQAAAEETTKKLFGAEAYEKHKKELVETMKKNTEGAKFEKKDVKIDGDKATVVVLVSKKGESKTKEIEVELVKEDGAWKVKDADL